MTQKTTLKTVVTALFAALICLATMLVQIPIPATGGYANLGDGVLLIASAVLPLPHAVLAAGVGSMLADLLTGYVNTGILHGEIENKSGIELPETGGIGTTLFYVIGGMLAVVAVVLLVTKKRMVTAE